MRSIAAFSSAAALLILCILFAASSGQYSIPPQTLADIIMLKIQGITPDGILSTPSMVFFSVRMPRIAMAITAGASLAVAGTVFQSILKNPLISPSSLGVNHGATFGASLAIIFIGKSFLSVETSAFIFAVAAVVIVYAIGNRGVNSITTLVIAGVIVSTFFMAGGSFLKYIADPYEQLPAIVFWTMGGLNNIVWNNIYRAFPVMAFGFAIIYFFRVKLNLMALGDAEALSMGVSVKKMRIMFLLAGTMMVAACSSSCGIIMWIDLIVAHIARIIIGPDHRRLIPFAALCGAVFLLATDTVVRIMPGGEIPISIITSFIGAPLLGYLLIKQSRQWK